MTTMRQSPCSRYFAPVALLAFLCSTQVSFAEDEVKPEEVYGWLKQLEGDWTLSQAEMQEGGTKTHPSLTHLLGTDEVAINFKLVGAQRTVQEDLLPGTKRQMVTMYHCRDSSCSAVKATHYCAKGNQPEFIASLSSSPQELKFDCDMSTELCQSWDAHIHTITHQLSEDGKHLRAVYSNYLNGEHTGDTVFHFDRKD